MAVNGVKIPEKHYVGMVKRQTEKIPLGFITPWGEDAAAKKRMDTVDSWAKQGYYGGKSLPAMVIENTPMAGFKMTTDIRSSSYGGVDKWRIEDPRLFYVTFGGNERAARERLQALIRDGLNAAVNVRTVKDVVSLERAAVMNQVLNSVVSRAKPLGVEIVDVRLKRIEFASEISESVYRLMESERLQVANETRAKGAAESERIRAEADREREQILAEAYGRAQAVMGEGDAKASALYADSFGRDPQFAQFYRSLEAYRASFNKKSDVMVLDPSSDFFRAMRGSGAAGSPPAKR